MQGNALLTLKETGGEEGASRVTGGLQDLCVTSWGQTGEKHC